MLNPGLFSFLKNYRAGSKNREICSRANQIPLSRNRQKQPTLFWCKISDGIKSL